VPGLPVGPSLLERFYPEARFGGFTRDDGGVEFFSRIAAQLRPTDHVLDYGAGRGAQIATDECAYRCGLKTLKGRVAHVEGCDVDPAVLENPYLDGAKVIDPGKPLPYPDASFHLVYSNWVFEHVEDPATVAAELLRVTKPGGYICAVTPNRHGYIALAARLAGNKRHVRLLGRIQPDRQAIDVFPTAYRLNTRSAVEHYFGKSGEVAVYAMSSEPAYHFGSALMFRLLRLVHKLTPGGLHTALFVFVRKNPA
jgi:SAM-dependent methyltransferase